MIGNKMTSLIYSGVTAHVSDYFNTNLASGQESQFDVSSQDVLITALSPRHSGRTLQMILLNK
jgi:hypothetical protein